MASLANTEERDNFFRLTLLLYRVGNQRLRAYFKSRWPIVHCIATGTTPPPWADTPNDAVTMKAAETKLLKFSFPDQKMKFDAGNTDEWDFTLLSLVLSKSSLVFVLPSSLEEKALRELKQIRNSLIGHAPDAGISNAIFTAEWQNACNALLQFNATLDDFASVEKDVKKPVDILIPILKECVAAEKELLDAINQAEERAAERHEEVLDAMCNHHDDLKETLQKGVCSVNKAIEESAKPRLETRKLQMIKWQRDLLQQRLVNFQSDVIASDLLDFLSCLTDKQKEEIAHDEKNFLPTKGVRTMIEKLEEHEEGFHQFVQALLKAGLSHVAVLLDADQEIGEEDTKEEYSFFTIVGTAADIRITVRIWDHQKIRQMSLEDNIALQFNKGFSGESKKLRKDFEKLLPKGVHFVYTKQLGVIEHATSTASEASTASTASVAANESTKHKTDSVVVVFRVAKINALDELWKMNQNNEELRKLLQKVLVSNFSTARKNEGNNMQNLTFEILFHEKNYMEVKNNLKEFDKSKSELECADNHVTSESVSQAAADTDQPDKPVLLKRTTSVISSQVYLDDGTHKELKLRDYQNELAAPAFEGRNTIICAPTNSGKTFVAMEIARRHLDAHRKDETLSETSSPRVVFVVNNLHLVLQQRAQFEEYLTDYRISDISGNNSFNITLEDLLKDNDVVVLTAQILVNALRDKKVRISEITLLVFDECHHTHGDASYNKVMESYMQVKQDKERLPQVIGLTASLGVGSSITRATEHVLQICANLDASNISTVRENTEDLINNVTGNVPVRKNLEVNNDEINIFEKEINKTIKEIEDYIQRTSTFDPPPTADRQSGNYRSWIEGLGNQSSLSAKPDIFKCSDHLRRYHEALLINSSVRIDDAVSHLQKYFDQLDQTKLTVTCTWLHGLYVNTKNLIEEDVKASGKPVNPLLGALQQQIVEFHQKPEAKGILFARTRDFTTALKRWIEETSEMKAILRADVLVGSGAGQDSLTQTQQGAVIQKFKTGEVNIIIATTVAEEGLDITDCSYVIRYGMLGNEISSVQSRGRIRAQEGSYVCVADSRSGGAEREKKNEFRELLMDSTVRQVQDLDTEEFLEMIKNIQEGNQREKICKEEKRISELIPVVGVTFYCKECNAMACHASDLRLYSNHNRVVVNADIFDRINIKVREKPQNAGPHFLNKKIYCKECGFDWGLIISTKNEQWPCLKIKSFVLEFGDSQDRQTFKQWKATNLEIPSADVLELYTARQSMID